MLKVLFRPNCQHFTQVKNITQTVKVMFQHNYGNESQREDLIWAMHCDARDFFGDIATIEDPHNDTGSKASLESIHALIGATIALALQDVPSQLFSPTQSTIVPVGAGEPGGKPRNTRETRKKIVHGHETISSATSVCNKRHQRFGKTYFTHQPTKS